MARRSRVPPAKCATRSLAASANRPNAARPVAPTRPAPPWAATSRDATATAASRPRNAATPASPPTPAAQGPATGRATTAMARAPAWLRSTVLARRPAAALARATLRRCALICAPARPAINARHVTRRMATARTQAARARIRRAGPAAWAAAGVPPRKSRVGASASRSAPWARPAMPCRRAASLRPISASARLAVNARRATRRTATATTQTARARIRRVERAAAAVAGAPTRRNCAGASASRSVR